MSHRVGTGQHGQAGERAKQPGAALLQGFGRRVGLDEEGDDFPVASGVPAVIPVAAGVVGQVLGDDPEVHDRQQLQAGVCSGVGIDLAASGGICWSSTVLSLRVSDLYALGATGKHPYTVGS
jgi:hypothetical protein